MAVRALGTTISIGGTLIGGLTEINGIDKSADSIDVTTLDSTGGYREFISGFKDGGEVSISGYFVPGNAGQAALETAFTNATTDTYIITFPATMGATWTFTGVVTKMTTGATLEDPVSFEATVKVSGVPTLGTTASGGLTALTLSGTAGALSPSFNNAKYGYSWSFTTDGSITVTPTAASHTIQLYVDGVFSQTITSGGTSTAVGTFTAASSKKFELICYEAGKTPKTYTIMAIRTS